MTDSAAVVAPDGLRTANTVIANNPIAPIGMISATIQAIVATNMILVRHPSTLIPSGGDIKSHNIADIPAIIIRGSHLTGGFFTVLIIFPFKLNINLIKLIMK